MIGKRKKKKLEELIALVEDPAKSSDEPDPPLIVAEARLPYEGAIPKHPSRRHLLLPAADLSPLSPDNRRGEKRRNAQWNCSSIRFGGYL